MESAWVGLGLEGGGLLLEVELVGWVVQVCSVF